MDQSGVTPLSPAVRPHPGFRGLVRGTLCLLTGLLVFTVVRQFIPAVRDVTNFWSFPYETEWGDGDCFGFTWRILHGLPIYGAPDQGTIYTIYTPFYYSLSATLHQWFDPELKQGLGLMRNINLVAWLLCFPLAAAAAWFTAPAGSGRWARSAAAGYAVIGLLLALYSFLALLWLRPDSLQLALSALTLTAAFALESSAGARWRGRWPATLLLAFLSVACLMTKQHGVGIPASLGCYYLWRRRWRELGRLVAMSAGIFALWLAWLELRNYGPVLGTTFIQLGQILNSSVKTVDSAQPLADWSTTRQLFLPYLQYYWPVWTLALAGVAGSLFRRQAGLLELSWVIILAMTIPLSRNIGAGASYLWLWWWLTTVLAAKALLFFWPAAETPAGAGDGWWPRFLRPGLAALLVSGLLWTVHHVTPNAVLQSRGYCPEPALYANGTAARLAKFREIIAARGPSAQALLDRSTAGWILAGGPPPIEACNLANALPAGRFNLDPVLAAIRRRDYALVSLSGWLAGIPSLRTAVDENYERVPELEPILATPGLAQQFYRPKPQ